MALKRRRPTMKKQNLSDKKADPDCRIGKKALLKAKVLKTTKSQKNVIGAAGGVHPTMQNSVCVRC